MTDELVEAQAAPHGLRLGAYLIDAVLVLVPALGVLYLTWFQWADTLVASGVSLRTFNGVESLVMSAIIVLTMTVFHAVFESSAWQASPGKRWLGLHVVHDDGTRLSFGQALGRAFLRALLLQLCGFLALAVVVDEAHRGPWGRLTTSRVIIGVPRP